MNSRPTKYNIYWRKALLFAKLLARLESGLANQRDIRVTQRLLEDQGVTNRLVEQAHRALQARRYQKRCALLDGLISKLQRGATEVLQEFKEANPTEAELLERLQRAIDFYRPAFEGEKRSDMAALTRRLWQELFGHDIDVREQIIRPVLRRQAEDWLLNAPDHKARARELVERLLSACQTIKEKTSKPLLEASLSRAYEHFRPREFALISGDKPDRSKEDNEQARDSLKQATRSLGLGFIGAEAFGQEIDSDGINRQVHEESFFIPNQRRNGGIVPEFKQKYVQLALRFGQSVFLYGNGAGLVQLIKVENGQ